MTASDDIGAFLKNIILGLLQGCTEFFPISSSGHLIAAKEILNFEASLAQDVALHIATLAAIIIYFRKDLLKLLVHSRRINMAVLLIVATIPGAGLGILLSHWRSNISPWWVVGGWSVSALYLITSPLSAMSNNLKERISYTELPLLRGVLIGTAQALAIFPGISRSGSSIVSGLWLGLEREAAFRFSFILSIPIITGAGLKTALDLDQEQINTMGGWLPVLSGMAIAFFVGLGAIHFLLQFVRKNRLHIFGWYNFLAATCFGMYMAFS